MPRLSSALLIFPLVFIAFLASLYILEYPALPDHLGKASGYIPWTSSKNTDTAPQPGRNESDFPQPGRIDSGFQPGEVVMITASAGTGGLAGAPGLKEMVYENRASYAQRWGYEFMWANITSYDFGAKIYWNKIPILREAFDRFPKAKWIWWLDLDIIIMTPSLDLHTHVLSEEGMLQQMLIDQEIVGVGGGLLGFKSLVDPKPDDMNFVIAQDLWGQNVGSFLMRRGDWSDWVLEMWADPLATAKDWVFPENDGWTHLFKNHQIVRDHTAIVTQRALNAYPDYNKLGEHWKDGDLLVHFAGCGSSKVCPVRWNEMWERRESYEVPEVIQQELANGTAKIEAFQKGDLFT